MLNHKNANPKQSDVQAARSAAPGAHQAVADYEQVSEEFARAVWENARSVMLLAPRTPAQQSLALDVPARCPHATGDESLCADCRSLISQRGHSR